MLDINVYYRIHLEMNLEELDANPENIMKLMDLFKSLELLPTTVRENYGNPSTIRNRIKLSSEVEGLSIMFGVNKLVITKKFSSVEESSNYSLKEFIRISLDILANLQIEFSKLASRIALTTEGLFSQIEEERLNELYYKFNTSYLLSLEKSPIQWLNKVINTIKKEINNSSEELNISSSFGRVQGQIRFDEDSFIDFDRMNFEVNINTIKENKESRFNYTGIKQFLNYALEIRENLLSEIERISNE